MRTDEEYEAYNAEQLQDSHLRKDANLDDQRVQELGEEREKDVVGRPSSHS